MSMRIIQLPPDVANQIAAGEVIERPASVVKELLENALDAGADTIHIDIGYGGLNQIKISDNGMGIVTDDLPLAIAAHATSKISQFNDLYALNSMGFRGEALASIASVSRLSISSKPDNQAVGSLLQRQAQSFTITPCARARGTTIDVRDIFFNAPVRKKFLKSERTEYQAIDNVVKRFALSAPEITISLSHNGKLQRHLPAALNQPSRIARISKLLGKSFVEQAIYLDVTHANMHLQGFISSETWQSSQTDKLWFYINQRMVRDKLVNHAIKQAYDSLLYPGRNPACLLYFTILPALIDVNVHPTKHEVRFQEPRLVHDFISSTLRQALQPTEPKIEPLAQCVASDCQVREAHAMSAYTVDSHSSPAVIKKPIQAPNWVIVNQRFAVLSDNNQYSLIDLMGLQAHIVRRRLQQSIRPLVSRPLLVPIVIESSLITKDSYLLLNQLLTSIGIQLEYRHDAKLFIRSLPIIVPDTDIKAFIIKCLTTSNMSESLLIDYLINNQSMALSWSREQLDDCYAYLSLDVDDVARQYVKHLSQQACQDFFDAK